VGMVMGKLFDPKDGLFEAFPTGSSTYRLSIQNIQKWDEIGTPSHVGWAEFAGHFLGKVLFDGFLAPAALTPSMYVMLLGQTPELSELLMQEDPEKEMNLQKLFDYEADMFENLYMYFTVPDETDQRKEIDLKADGRDIMVTKDNLEEYVQLFRDWYLRKRVEKMILAFCNGFWEVIGDDHKIFSAEELKELICGRVELDMEDWKANTAYLGEYEHQGANHPTIQLFWAAIEDMEMARRSDLLNFVTGCPTTPLSGFGALEKVPGQKMLFTVNSKRLREGMLPHERYPKGHTCMNTVDLPLYTDKDTMVSMLNAISDPLASRGKYIEE